MLRWLCLAALAAMLSACGSIPPINFSVPNVAPSPTKLDADVKSITVTVASAEEATGKLDPNTSLLTQYWKTSIEEALDRMAVFRDDAPRKVSIAVKILRLELSVGATATVNASARYQIIDRATGAVAFTTDINTEGQSTLDYSLAGVARNRKALNHAVQENILKFLQALPNANLGKT
jgi:hypothetical protein